jgi:spore germination cell wall hydrolase CwlJ-like protein
MIRTVRAVAYAAVALSIAASAVWGGPVLAGQGDFAPVETTYLQHETADIAVSDLGLNDETTTVAAAPATQANGIADHGMALAEAPAARSLDDLVATYAASETRSAEEHCLASAVYFEARGESLEGQLAVAEVVINRAASNRYPRTLCGVVVQPAQFSFVRGRVIPRADERSEAWRRAVAIARIAGERVTRLLPANVLWYHANYVSPGWGRRLERNAQIGLHIFYS